MNLKYIKYYKNVLLSFSDWKTVIEKLVILNVQIYFLP